MDADESSSESSEDGHLLSKDGCSRSTSTSTSNRFNPRQRTVHYCMDMVGTGNAFDMKELLQNLGVLLIK